MDKSSVKIKSLVLLAISMIFLVFLINIQKIAEVTGILADGNGSDSRTESLNKNGAEPVTSFSEAVISVKTLKNTVELTPWLAEDGNYYIALPSMAQEICFDNIAEGSLTFSDSEDLSAGSCVPTGSYISAESIIGSTLALDSSEKLTITRSENISAMFITLDVSQGDLDAQQGTEYSGKCTLLDAEGNTSDTGSFEYIATRGNSTFGQAKKPYEIAFSKKTELLSGCEGKKWILLANAFDKSLLKGAAVYNFVNQYTNLPTTSGEFVDLYINGDYRGNYYLCIKPQTLGQVLDITDLDEYNELSNSYSAESNAQFGYSADGTAYGLTGMNSYSDITGGYLVEFTIQIDDEHPHFTTCSGATARVRWPQNATLEEVEYIRDRFNELEKAAFSADGINPDTGKSIEDYLDMESYAARFLTDSIFQNLDSDQASSYFYKDADSVDEKIYAGPLWDYDLTFQFTDVYSVMDTSTVGSIYLSDELLNHDNFREVLSNQYYSVFKPYVKYMMSASLYSTDTLICRSRELNNMRWNITLVPDQYSIDNYLAITIDRLCTIEERLLGEDQYCTVTFKDIKGDNYKVIAVRQGETIEDIPELTSWEYLFNGWTDEETGKTLNAETKIWSDTVFISNWIPVHTIVENGLSIGDINVDGVDVDTLEKIVEDIEERQSEGQ